jgi:hypothetical protein
MATLRLRRGGVTASAPRACNSARRSSLSNALSPRGQQNAGFPTAASPPCCHDVDPAADKSRSGCQSILQRHDLAGQTAARAPDRLSPPFAPVAIWSSRTMVPSAMTYSKAGSWRHALNRRSNTPATAQRRKRRNTEFQAQTSQAGPATVNRSAQSIAQLPQTAGYPSPSVQDPQACRELDPPFRPIARR